jgi:hypothetical protein
MNIAILTLDAFNELDSFISCGILNRMRSKGWKAYITSLLMLGICNLLAEPTANAQAARDAQTAGRTLTRSVVEGPSSRGNMTVLSEVVDETVRRDSSSSQRTRREFVADAEGRQRLSSTMEEQRAAQPDGGHQITREFMDVDFDGRSRTTRREREQRTSRGGGLFVTDIEVTQSSINAGGFVPTERVQQQERRVADQVVERQATTSVDPLGRGTWSVVEQRMLTRSVANGRAEAVELIYRPDPTGNLVPSERVVSSEWTVGDQAFRTDDIYRQDINNAGSLAGQPVRQVEIVRTTLSDGGSETTRTVSERLGGDRLQVTERAVERTRQDGPSGRLIDQEVQRSIVYGRLETIATGRIRESQP